MANFCGGDFYSLPGSRGSMYGGARKPGNFAQTTAGRGAAARGTTVTETQFQGVSQWGRQQLDSRAQVSRGDGKRGRGTWGSAGGGKGRGETGWGERRSWNEGASVSGLSHRSAIQDLSPHQADTKIVGIVVTKHSIHSFPDKRNPGYQRFRFTFTLRDSPSDYINVTCWGSDVNYITKLRDSFQICDIIEIRNGQILSKLGSESEEKWNAWTPSPYQINVSENHSVVTLYSGPDYAEFSSLAHAPLRPVEDCHTLSSIISDGQDIDGSHINILAAVVHVGKPKEMMSKSGRQLKKCEVKLMDSDCSSFRLLIWEEELIQLAQTWTPKENIIFAVDVKASFDTYRNCMTAVCDQKTLIITNPDCNEAHQLFQFVQSVEISPECDEDLLDTGIVSGNHQDNIQTISEVYSIEELLEMQEKGVAGAHPQMFTGILYAYLTQFSITGDTTAVICYRCSSCKFRGQFGTKFCSNANCQFSALANPTPFSTHSSSYSDTTRKEEFSMEPHFNLLVSLSDYSGGIEGIWLGGLPACEVLGRNPMEFLNCNDEEKQLLKTSLQLEKFKVYFKSGVCQADKKKPLVKILSMSPVNPKEAVAHMGIM